jgi:hypothetical protein
VCRVRLRLGMISYPRTQFPSGHRRHVSKVTPYFFVFSPVIHAFFIFSLRCSPLNAILRFLRQACRIEGPREGASPSCLSARGPAEGGISSHNVGEKCVCLTALEYD